MIAQEFLASARATRARAMRARDVRFAQKSRARAIFAQVKEIAAFARATYCAFAHLKFLASRARNVRARDQSSDKRCFAS